MFKPNSENSGACLKTVITGVFVWSVDFSESRDEFRDPTGGQMLMALVNFCALKADINDLEVYLKMSGGQISVSVLKGNVT